jgi:hypothetical protein
LGIYCNGFSGCGALGPHKCNQSDLSHSIKEIEIVEKNIPINTLWHLRLAFYPAYLIGKCIGQVRERGECSGYFLLRESEEKGDRDYKEVHSRNFVTSFPKYNKDKVPVDVATSLVVNHVNIGVLCPSMLCCVYAYGKVTELDNT